MRVAGTMMFKLWAAASFLIGAAFLICFEGPNLAVTGAILWLAATLQLGMAKWLEMQGRGQRPLQREFVSSDHSGRTENKVGT